ncbi:uncharacterized protein EI90DRAFT_3125133 [Cantharellus anzutake]|uniref:uncharacterized protein n=1 Tax=Cantharellus anzutake TaxID=1750568 RepID=UPI00190546D8|nr:uncharacterized protein EI90DRAFT_3125133 [Cantharellus anzutake]KAF8329340.1 hypothetical protein EI90DRAFT_3125133 [Cantharellus anzutake]
MPTKVTAAGKPSLALKEDSGFRGFFRKLSLSKKGSSTHEELVAPPPPYKASLSPTSPARVIDNGTHYPLASSRNIPLTCIRVTPDSATSPSTRPPRPDLTPEEREKRRARRLSKPPRPAPTPASACTPNVVTGVYPTGDPKPHGSSRTSLSSFFLAATATTRTGTPKNNVDSSGRTRPPVSGTPARTRPGAYRHPNPLPNTANSKNNNNAPSIGHAYHYQRTRTNSSTDLSRHHEAISCLEAVLKAYDANLVTDVRHVMEQVALARDILVGEDYAGSGNASTAFLMKSAKTSELSVDSVELPPPPARSKTRERRSASPKGSSSSSDSSMGRKSGDSLGGASEGSEASSVTSADSKLAGEGNRMTLFATIPSFPLASPPPKPLRQ